MQKKVLYRNLELGVINLGGLLKDLRSKEFTGYIKNRGWNYEDYVAFWEGSPIRVISVGEDGSREELKLSDYIWIDRGKTIDVVETDPLTLANLFRDSFSVEDSRALILAGFGEEITEPIRFSLFNLENAVASFKRGHFTGYILWTNPTEIIGMCLFYDGSPIALNVGKTWDMEAQSIIASKVGGNTYVHIYALDPEIVLIANSLRIGVGKQTFFSIKEVDTGVYEETDSWGGMYSFIYRGQSVVSYRVKDGEVDVVNPDFEGSVSVWSMELITTPTPIEISLSRDSVEVIPSEVAQRIKEMFVDEIGPVGPILWNRILSDLGLDESHIPKNMVDKLLNKLASEIPEGKHSEAFLSKVRRFVE